MQRLTLVAWLLIACVGPAVAQTAANPDDEWTRERLVEWMRHHEQLIQSLRAKYHIEYGPTKKESIESIKEVTKHFPDTGSREWQNYVISDDKARQWNAQGEIWRQGIRERTEVRKDDTASPLIKVSDGAILRTYKLDNGEGIGEIFRTSESTWSRENRLTPFSSAYEWFGKPYSQIISQAKEVTIAKSTTDGTHVTTISIDNKRGFDLVLGLDSHGRIAFREVWGTQRDDRSKKRLLERMSISDYDKAQTSSGESISLPVRIENRYYVGAAGAAERGNIEYMSNIITVDTYELNTIIPEERFTLSFPPGTKVWDGIFGLGWLGKDGAYEQWLNRRIDELAVEVAEKVETGAEQVSAASLQTTVPDDNQNGKPTRADQHSGSTSVVMILAGLGIAIALGLSVFLVRRFRSNRAKDNLGAVGNNA